MLKFQTMLSRLFVIVTFIVQILLVNLTESLISPYNYDNKFEPRITKGEEVKIEEVSYVVRIVIGAGGVCSGGIINESWVLTAAHCVDTKEKITVFAGIDDKTDKTGQERAPLKKYIHKDYVKGKISKHDIALIKVEPFQFNKKVGFIELSGNEWPQEHKYTRPCLAAGWGVPEIGEKSVTKLQKLEVLARHGQYGCRCWQTFHNKRLICLQGQSGFGACKGDSGSVLACDRKAEGVAHMIYLVQKCSSFSFGSYELKCSDTSSAYIYICPYLNWISSYVSNVPKQPLSCKGCHISHNLVYVILFVLLLFLKL